MAEGVEVSGFVDIRIWCTPDSPPESTQTKSHAFAIPAYKTYKLANSYTIVRRKNRITNLCDQPTYIST